MTADALTIAALLDVTQDLLTRTQRQRARLQEREAQLAGHGDSAGVSVEPAAASCSSNA